jgi:hypothetical protein
MKRLALSLLVAAAVPAGAASAADQLAPPVTRKPPAAANAPAAQPTSLVPRTASCGPGTVPCARPPLASEDSYFSALSASGTGGDPILDKGLMKTMSRLMAANRCNDAVALATQNGRAELAGRATQICKAN